MPKAAKPKAPKKKALNRAGFLRLLRKTKRRWHADQVDDRTRYALRCQDGRCPIIAVALSKGYVGPIGNFCWHEAAQWLRLPYRLGQQIVKAADSSDNTPLHKALFKACGIAL